MSCLLLSRLQQRISHCELMYCDQDALLTFIATWIPKLYLLARSCPATEGRDWEDIKYSGTNWALKVCEQLSTQGCSGIPVVTKLMFYSPYVLASNGLWPQSKPHLCFQFFLRCRKKKQTLHGTGHSSSTDPTVADKRPRLGIFIPALRKHHGL